MQTPLTYIDLIRCLEKHIKKDFEEGANISVIVHNHAVCDDKIVKIPTLQGIIEIKAHTLDGEYLFTDFEFFNHKASIEELIEVIEQHRSNDYLAFLQSCEAHREELGYGIKDPGHNYYEDLRREIKSRYLDKLDDGNADIRVIYIDFYNYAPSLISIGFNYNNNETFKQIRVYPRAYTFVEEVLRAAEFIRGVLGLQLASRMRKYPDIILRDYEDIVREQFSFGQFRRVLEQYEVEPII